MAEKLDEAGGHGAGEGVELVRAVYGDCGDAAGYLVLKMFGNGHACS
jgi:hypothetical protein